MSAPLRPLFRPVKTAFSATLLALALGLSILSCAEPESFEAESYLDSLITKTERRAISALPEGGEIKPGTTIGELTFILDSTPVVSVARSTSTQALSKRSHGLVQNGLAWKRQ